jgi:hypothetical protein
VGVQLALSAQELEKVYSQVVILNKNSPVMPRKDGSLPLDAELNCSYGVEHTKLAPVLIGAMQEIKAEDDNLGA